MRLALWDVACGGESAQWECYRRLADGRRPSTLRDLLEIVEPSEGAGCEPSPAIDVLRDCVTTGGMSLGALTAQAHEAIAHAANSIGMLSNSGEGGESPRPQSWGGTPTLA